MMYYIDRISCATPNRKCVELQEFVKQFEHTLISDGLSRDALIEDICHKLEDLNEAYPRTKKLVVQNMHDCIVCVPEQRTGDSDAVFAFSLRPVRRTYRFSEPATKALTEGGEE